MAVIIKRTTKKKIYDILTKYGFSANDFNFKETNEVFFEIKYMTEPEYFFRADKYINYCPGVGNSRLTATDFKTFEFALNKLDEWASLLKEEIEIGDPWKGVIVSSGFQNAISDTLLLNEFSLSEQNFVIERIDNILSLVDKNREDYNEIKKEMTHLKELLNSNRITKKDWLLLFISTAVSGGWSIIFANETISAIWQQLSVIFNNDTVQQMLK